MARSPQTGEHDPQLSDALGTDTPEEVGVKLAESLVREPITESDRRRQRLLPGGQLRNAGVVFQCASDGNPAECQRSLPVYTGCKLVAALAYEQVDLVQRL
jgi:hypothetical protein